MRKTVLLGGIINKVAAEATVIELKYMGEKSCDKSSDHDDSSKRHSLNDESDLRYKDVIDLKDSGEMCLKLVQMGKQKDLDALWLKKGRETIDYDLWFLFRAGFGLVSISDHRMEFYKFMSSYIRERLDIITYLKNLEMVDKLRWLVLNYHQNMSLEYIKNPNLANEKEYEILKDRHDIVNVVYELVQYYTDKIRTHTMDEKDEKLFEILNHDIKNIFDAFAD